jgi:anaerobic ribonucleoside-triphosphate reductase
LNEEEMQQERQKVKLIPCEVYSRIVGYMRPIQSWNKGKQQEFMDREEFDVTSML